MAPTAKVVILADAKNANSGSRIPFIEQYYRVGLTPSTALSSVLTLHNQTLNVWTHLFGAAYFFYMTAFRWEIPPAPVDAFCCYLMIAASVACFVSSASYHTLLSVSDGFARSFLTLDVLCIVGLILASFVAGLHVGFYCDYTIGLTYLSITVALLGLAAAQLVVPCLRDNPKLESARTVFIAGVVGWGLIPASHWVIAGPDAIVSHATWGLAEMFFFYGTGFIVFYTHFPECLFPGRFDLFFASHQWWHIATFLAALTWTNTVIDAYNVYLTKAECQLDGTIHIAL